jgi:hypothetical protein
LNKLGRFEVRRMIELCGLALDDQEIDRITKPFSQALYIMSPLLKEKISEESEPTSYMDRIRKIKN